MSTIKMTIRSIVGLKISRKRTDYFDAALPGLCLRIAPSGRKTWCVMYRHAGRFQRMTLGQFPALGLADAREMAKEALRQSAKGTNPGENKLKQRVAETFGELAEKFIADYVKPRKRSAYEDERIIRKYLLPQFKNVKAKELTRASVRNLLDEMVLKTPIMANRTLACIRKMYNWAISKDLVEHNPCHRIQRPGREQQRDRVLLEDEIQAVWKALDAEKPLMAATFRLRLLTAQRGVEVHTMRWKDVVNGWWTIPAEVSKNRLSHRVPLSPQASKVLQKLKAISGDSEWIFPNPERTDHIYECQKLAQRVRRISGVDFRAHDLRRTAASMMTSMGTSRLVVAKILNHVERGVTAVYDRYSYDSEKKKALDAWGRKVHAIVAGLREIPKSS